MQRALDLASKGLGKTYPNPAVGCVIVKNEHVNLSSVCHARRICAAVRRSLERDFIPDPASLMPKSTHYERQAALLSPLIRYLYMTAL